MHLLQKTREKLRPHATINNGVLAVAIVIAATWAWSTIEAIQRNFSLQQQVDALNQQVSVDDLQNKTLQLQNQYYGSSEYQELAARAQLGKALPGEKLLILPPNTVHQTAPAIPQGDKVAITDRSNFAQWMYFLFGKKTAGF